MKKPKELFGGPGHAVDDAGRLVLGNGVPAEFPKPSQAARAVAAHAGEQDGDAGTSPGRCQAIEEDVHAWPIRIGRRLRGVCKALVRRKDGVLGAVGVSGGKPEQDLDCAEAGLRAI